MRRRHLLPQVGAHGSEMWRDKWWEEAYAQSVATISGHNTVSCCVLRSHSYICLQPCICLRHWHEHGSPVCLADAVNCGCAQEVSKLPTESSSDSDSSNSDDSMAEVPASAARRVHADGTASSATDAEHKLAMQLAKDPWGRFGGRQGKLARIRAQEQAALQAQQAASAAVSQSAAASRAVTAAAAAGAADSDAASPRQKHAKRRKRDAAQLLEVASASAAAAAPETAAQPSGKRKKGKKAAQQQKAAAAVPAQPREPTAADLAAEAAAAAMRAFKPTPATGWWGAKRFVSSGALMSTQGGAPAAAHCLHPTSNFQPHGIQQCIKLRGLALLRCCLCF